MTEIHRRLLAPRLSRSGEAHGKGVGWHYTPLPQPRRAAPLTSSDGALKNRRILRRTAEVGLAPARESRPTAAAHAAPASARASTRPRQLGPGEWNRARRSARFPARSSNAPFTER